jgi:hypothetical protein
VNLNLQVRIRTRTLVVLRADIHTNHEIFVFLLPVQTSPHNGWRGERSRPLDHTTQCPRTVRPGEHARRRNDCRVVVSLSRWDHGGPWQGAQGGQSGFAGCFWPCALAVRMYGRCQASLSHRLRRAARMVRHVRCSLTPFTHVIPRHPSLGSPHVTVDASAWLLATRGMPCPSGHDPVLGYGRKLALRA